MGGSVFSLLAQASKTVVCHLESLFAIRTEPFAVLCPMSTWVPVSYLTEVTPWGMASWGSVFLLFPTVVPPSLSSTILVDMGGAGS